MDYLLHHVRRNSATQNSAKKLIRSLKIQRESPLCVYLGLLVPYKRQDPAHVNQVFYPNKPALLIVQRYQQLMLLLHNQVYSASMHAQSLGGLGSSRMFPSIAQFFSWLPWLVTGFESFLSYQFLFFFYEQRERKFIKQGMGYQIPCTSTTYMSHMNHQEIQM